MKILVTGGCGFIGSNFLHYSVKKYDDEFVCLDLLTYAGNYDNVKELENRNNYKFVKGDIRDRKFLYDLFKKEKFDIVINFAAESHVDNSIKNPNIFAETNILGTINLLNVCNMMKDIHPIKRYHQVSTDEVYGDLPLSENKIKFDENSLLKPSSPYSASKASADLETLAYFRTFKLPVTISRCSNNYGSYQYPEKLIPLVINNALKNKKIPVYGKGENVRDWINVFDHVTGIDKVVREGTIGQIYNISGHSERTNICVVKFILSYLNKSESLIEYVDDRPGHDLKYAIDSTKIEKELGWKNTFTFEEGIKETIEWYLNNKEWLENLNKRIGKNE